MGNWNYTDDPIAYLITFRTYGTWLPGDERGSIDKYHNKYLGERAVASEERRHINASRLKSPPVVLNAECRRVVEMTIREVCAFRGWSLMALNVRTNHAHVVVGAGAISSARMLNDFKAYSTRRMREAGVWDLEHNPWVDKGSRRFLWNERHVVAAVEYVLNGQGGPLPEFD
jgi:REP element-mobilizing transposase RayT